MEDLRFAEPANHLKAKQQVGGGLGFEPKFGLYKSSYQYLSSLLGRLTALLEVPPGVSVDTALKDPTSVSRKHLSFRVHTLSANFLLMTFKTETHGEVLNISPSS